MHGETVKSDNM